MESGRLGREPGGNLGAHAGRVQIEQRFSRWGDAVASDLDTRPGRAPQLLVAAARPRSQYIRDSPAPVLLNNQATDRLMITF